MPRLSGRLLLAFVVTTVAGACLHFLYDLLPNPVTALFSPVNESLWEHGKILFWPYLAAMLVLTRRGAPGCRTPWLLTAPLMVCAMLAAGWLYHFTLGGEAMAVDIGIYVAVMALGFLLPQLSGAYQLSDEPSAQGIAAQGTQEKYGAALAAEKRQTPQNRSAAQGSKQAG